jgi:hypothetical protein
MEAVDLTAMQRRTVRSLLGDGAGRAFDDELPERLRAYLEGGIAHVATTRLRLSKERLNDLDRCEGAFAAAIAGERPPFQPTRRNAVGVLLHRALEVDAVSPRAEDPDALVDVAARALADDRRFGPFWAGLDDLGRATVRADALAGIELFRASFPPLGPARRLLAPAAERWVAVALAGGRVSVTGRIDLIVGRFEPRLATRVLVDLKTGSAWPEHAEDMRLYALLFTLRHGVPPLRVASFFLRSGECQPEDVTEEILQRSADRVIDGVRTAVRLGVGSHARPALAPGPWCAWCPRQASCPAARAASGRGVAAAWEPP